MNEQTEEHAKRKMALLASLRAMPAEGPLRLAKHTSNLFRGRAPHVGSQLDLGEFNHVLHVNVSDAWVDVEGLTTYETLVDAVLPMGLMPAVVPQLKTITVGGALAGVGIEATSFRNGLVHDSVLELDVVLPDGRILTCTPTNEHNDLFFGFPNSYGTLGYALRARLRTLKTKPFVQVRHYRLTEIRPFLDTMARACEGPADFVDGVVFGPECLVVSVARFVDEAPSPSDYTYKNIYYRSLLDKRVDNLRTVDYIWRWDTDWFWCSRNVYAHHPIVRCALGPDHLNSRTYTRLMRWNERWGLTRRLARLRGRHPESVIQDVDIPFAHAAEFLTFLFREIGILPIWTCPVRSGDRARRFPLYPLSPDTMYVNFGFWDVIDSLETHPVGHFNRLVEHEVIRLEGIKSLYSDSFFSFKEFAEAYGMEQFATLKTKYDPQGRASGLYEKCVLRA